MFDKLIESELAGADIKNRRRFFMLSTVVVGILFLTAVVIDIYAQDFALGSEQFEVQSLLAPVEMSAQAPEPPRPRSTTPLPSSEKSSVAVRTESIARTDEAAFVPIGVSTDKTNAVSRPRGEYVLGNENTNPIGTGRATDSGTSGLATPDSQATTAKPAEDADVDVKPPPVVKAPAKPAPPRSLGVVNSLAISLPKPVYPAAAIAMGAQGAVNVQVMIDEAGKVVSANAMNGNPLLRNAAEQAARNARFTPTLLSHVPVKVTGLIVYNFSR